MSLRIIWPGLRGCVAMRDLPLPCISSIFRKGFGAFEGFSIGVCKELQLF